MSVKNSLLKTVLTVEGLIRTRSTTQPRSILILEYLLPLGCCVHLTPLYEALKQSRPELVITVATHGLAAKLLRHNPYIDHLIESPDALTNTVAAARHLRGELRRRNLVPDMTMTGASDKRSRIALLALLGSSGRRVGYTLVPQLYEQAFEYDHQHSLIDNNLRLAAAAACRTDHREPSVFFSSADLSSARTLVAEANPDNKPLLILVTQPSGGQSTGWHMDRFAEVARHAVRNLGLAVAYVGIQADRTSIKALQAASGVIGINLAGRTSITELAALLALSDYLVSLDTGTMHLGRAIGIPLVVLGPSWQKPIEWLPLGLASARILRGPDCDTVAADYKLDEVTAPQVLAALQELLADYPPTAEARSARITRSLSQTDLLPSLLAAPALHPRA